MLPGLRFPKTSNNLPPSEGFAPQSKERKSGRNQSLTNILNNKINVPIEKFAKLTGRSLSTFKRDFRKPFDIPPRQWLLKKRLEQVHYLIAQKHIRPADVYVDVVVENFSHFSTAFKQRYRYNPSSLCYKSKRPDLFSQPKLSSFTK